MLYFGFGECPHAIRNERQPGFKRISPKIGEIEIKEVGQQKYEAIDTAFVLARPITRVELSMVAWCRVHFLIIPSKDVGGLR